MANPVALIQDAGEKKGAAPIGSKREARLLALSSTVSVALALALIALTYAVRLEASRLLVLRLLLALAAALEASGGLPQLLSARRFIATNGWPDHRVYHAVVQDAGVYNLGWAMAFALAALDPVRHVGILQAGVFLFLLHASAHLMRYFGTVLGGEPYFPPRLELAAALPLVTLGVGVIMFYPF